MHVTSPNQRTPRWRRGFTRQPECSKRAHFRGPGASNKPKIQQERPTREGKKNRSCGGKREKKRDILGPSPFGPPPFGTSTLRGTHPSGPLVLGWGLFGATTLLFKTSKIGQSRNWPKSKSIALVRRRALRRRAVRWKAVRRKAPKLAQMGSARQKTAQIGQFQVVAKISLAVAKSRSWPQKGRGKLGLATEGHNRQRVATDSLEVDFQDAPFVAQWAPENGRWFFRCFPHLQFAQFGSLPTVPHPPSSSPPPSFPFPCPLATAGVAVLLTALHHHAACSVRDSGEERVSVGERGWMGLQGSRGTSPDERHGP